MWDMVQRCRYNFFALSCYFRKYHTGESANHTGFFLYFLKFSKRPIILLKGSSRVFFFLCPVFQLLHFSLLGSSFQFIQVLCFTNFFPSKFMTLIPSTPSLLVALSAFQSLFPVIYPLFLSSVLGNFIYLSRYHLTLYSLTL